MRRRNQALQTAREGTEGGLTPSSSIARSTCGQAGRAGGEGRAPGRDPAAHGEHPRRHARALRFQASAPFLSRGRLPSPPGGRACEAEEKWVMACAGRRPHGGEGAENREAAGGRDAQAREAERGGGGTPSEGLPQH